MRNPNAAVSDPNSFLTCPGDKVHIIYGSRFNGSKVVLVEEGRQDIQESINAHAPYTDLAYMLSRLKVGDTSVLSSKRPIYGDFSGMPANPVDAINMVHAAESHFNTMSFEEKQKYNNDYRVWLASIFAGDHDSSICDVRSSDVDDTLLTDKEAISNES